MKMYKLSVVKIKNKANKNKQTLKNLEKDCKLSRGHKILLT